MNPWAVPIAVAVITAMGGIIGAWMIWRGHRLGAETKETELAITGLATLVAEERKSREYCQQELRALRAEFGEFKSDMKLRDLKEKARDEGYA